MRWKTVSACLDLAALMAQHAEFKQASIEARLEDGFLDCDHAHGNADQVGVPMRLAHEQVGSLVRTCIEKKCRLADLPWSVFKEVSPNLKPEDEITVAERVGCQTGPRRLPQSRIDRSEYGEGSVGVLEESAG